MSGHGVGSETALWERYYAAAYGEGPRGEALVGMPKCIRSRGTKTVKHLFKLARRIQRYGNDHPNTSDNTNIPAGYTYLGQIVAHDLTRIADPTFLMRSELRETSRDRPNALMLETIYGDGPVGSPGLYLECDRSRAANRRCGRLRVGLTAERDRLGDIPRTMCPSSGRTGLGEDNLSLTFIPSLEDPRNDSNLLTSQMVLLFINLHNKFYDAVVSTGEIDELVAFNRARRCTIAVYHQILKEDYFPRLLNADVFAHYLGQDTCGRDFRNDGESGIPAAFKHGAFRVGHSMIRGKYQISTVPHQVAFKMILARTSERRPYRLPVENGWVIDWAEFFEDSTGSAPRNWSRKLGPSIASGLASGIPFADRRYDGAYPDLAEFSLVLHDNLRACERVRIKLKTIRGRIPDELVPAGSLLHDLGDAETDICNWLLDPTKNQTGGEEILNRDEASWLAKHPPLPFLIGLEAVKDEDGARFGPVGSAIIASVAAPHLRSPNAAALKDAKDLLGLPNDQALRNLGRLVQVLSSAQ
ncbi:MAG: peroxidase family protein [Pseudomonadota bacterium]